jgi:pyridoxal phosphate enzyme (YggS family)
MLIFYKMGISETLTVIRERINSSAIKSGRNPDKIRLVAATKTVALKSIVEALKEGVTILGENRVQEARTKIKALGEYSPALKPEWHFIGNLQKNKAKTAVRLFDLIHSIDSLSLAEELNRHLQRKGGEQRVLVQVKLSDESAKYGILEKELMQLLEKVAAMDHIKVEGLMTMPPYFDNPEKARPYFRKLKKLADKASAEVTGINELSMGMTNDFEVAIEEGATLVRIGTAIFGERHYRT